MSGIGHNNPPPSPRDAHTTNLSDLLTESVNWCDGSPIETELQAEEVQRLMRLLQEATDAADGQRKAEKLPHDEVIEEIQGFWNPWIAPLTNKKPGKASLAIQACQNALTAWLRKVAAAQEALAREERLKAEQAAAAAQEALEAARASSDLGAMDKAEDAVDFARQAATVAAQAEKAKPRVEGMGRAAGLRDHWTVKGFVPVDNPDGDPTPGDTAAFRWFWANRRDDMRAMLLDMANAEVRRGRRQIDGIDIRNEPRAG